MKSIPTVTVEQIDTEKVMKALQTGKTVNWACTQEQRKSVQLAAHRLGLRRLTRAKERGFSFQMNGTVKTRTPK